MPSFDYISKKAKAPAKSWSNLNKLRFHFFNPNGAYQKWRDMCDTLTQYVDNDLLNSGYLFAYGSLSRIDESITALIDSNKTRISDVDLWLAVKWLTEYTDKGYTAIGEAVEHANKEAAAKYISHNGEVCPVNNIKFTCPLATEIAHNYMSAIHFRKKHTKNGAAEITQNRIEMFERVNKDLGLSFRYKGDEHAAALAAIDDFDNIFDSLDLHATHPDYS